jgi:hypothetical protein
MKWIAKRMCQEDGPRLAGDMRLIELLGADVECDWIAVDKYRNEPVLHDRRNGCRKSRGRRDALVAVS